jgi:hypothetical protein
MVGGFEGVDRGVTKVVPLACIPPSHVYNRKHAQIYCTARASEYQGQWHYQCRAPQFTP